MYVCCSHNVRLNFLLQLLKLVATSTYYAPEDSHSRALSLLLEQWNTSKSNLHLYEPIQWAQSNRLPKPTLGPKRNLCPRKASMSNEALIKKYRCSSVRHVIIHGARAWARVTWWLYWIVVHRLLALLATWCWSTNTAFYRFLLYFESLSSWFRRENWWQ